MKRISKISYENGFEDGYEKAIKETAMKGWTGKRLEHEPLLKDDIHVHQTSPSAIEGEAVASLLGDYVCALIPLPLEYENKKVKYLVWVEEER